MKERRTLILSGPSEEEQPRINKKLKKMSEKLDAKVEKQLKASQ